MKRLDPIKLAFVCSHCSRAGRAQPNGTSTTPICSPQARRRRNLFSGPAKPGTIDAVIIRYVKSDAFKALAPSTQAARRRILDHFADFKTPGGRPYGSNRLRTMLEPDVEAVLGGKPATSKRDWLRRYGTGSSLPKRPAR